MAADTFANNAVSTLLNPVTSSGQTTLVLVSGSLFPSSGDFRIKVLTEIMICTARTGSTLTVTRGAESTTAASSYSASATVRHIITKGMLELFPQKAFASTITGAWLYSSTITVSGTLALSGIMNGAGSITMTSLTLVGNAIATNGLWTFNQSWTGTGATAGIIINSTINQSGTASHVDFTIARTHTATGSGVQYFLKLTLGGSHRLWMSTAGNLNVSGSMEAATVLAATDVAVTAGTIRVIGAGSMSIGGAGNITVANGDVITTAQGYRLNKTLLFIDEAEAESTVYAYITFSGAISTSDVETSSLEIHNGSTWLVSTAVSQVDSDTLRFTFGDTVAAGNLFRFKAKNVLSPQSGSLTAV